MTEPGAGGIVPESPEALIADLAELQFTDAEIAIIMEMDAQELIDRYGQAVDRGRLQAEAEVRRSIYKMARQGSAQAQKQFMLLNEAAKKSQIKREEI